MKHRKIAWVCLKCNWLQVSDSREHHKMDFCKCGETGLDLEEYQTRVAGLAFRVIAELEEGKGWKVKLGRRKK